MIRAPALASLCMLASALIVAPSYAKDAIPTGSNLIFISPEVGYAMPRVFVQGRNAAYGGLHYGGSLYYRIGDEDFSWAPFAGYRQGSFESDASTAFQSESFSEKTFSFGLKFYFGNFFLKAMYSRTDGKLESSGTTHSAISDTAWGYGGSLGYSWPVSSYLNLEFSGDVLNTKFPAKPAGFTSATQFLRYGATLGISILLPSAPSRKSYYIPGS
jgi:hypothetical protein